MKLPPGLNFPHEIFEIYGKLFLKMGATGKFFQACTQEVRSKTLRVVFAFFLAFSLFFFLSQQMRTYPLHDPDRYFHFRLSEIQAKQGTLHSLPQFEDLGWNKSFPEKEYLFHQLSTLFWKIGGESAVATIPYWIGSAILLLLGLIVFRKTQSAWVTFFLLALAMSTPDFFIRLTLLRPHLLAILFWIGLMGARRWPWIAAVCAFLFALSYHAFYMPLTVLVPFLFERESRKTAICGIIGLGLGTVLNPFFPSNWAMGLNHIRIALYPEILPQLDLAIEHRPQLAKEFFRANGGLLIPIALALALWEKVPRALLGTTVACWLLATLHPRAIEYAAPAAIILLATLFQTGILPKNLKALRPHALVLLLGILSFHIPNALRFFSQPLSGPIYTDWVRESVRHLPQEAQGQKLFNCNWDDGAVIFYERPDVRTVDVLDPMLLAFQAPDKFQARIKIQNGSLPDPYPVLKEGFKADWILCKNNAAIQLFELDPRFTRIFPDESHLHPDGPQFPFLYKIEDSVEKHFIRNWLIRTPSGDFSQFSVPASLFEWVTLPQVPCSEFQIPETELVPHLGRQWITVGGSSEIAVWRNAKPIYHSIAPASSSQLIRHLIDLGQPLQKGDRISAKVCGLPSAPRASLSLSFWTWKEMGERCQLKGFPLDSLQTMAFQSAPTTCLGPIVPMLKTSPK